MKTLRLALIGFAALGLLRAALGQDLNLNGYWESDAEGTVRIQHDTDTGYVLIEAAPCPNGAQRPHILAGALQGNVLTGTMWRCTNQELIDECGHPQIYNVSFSASVRLNTDPMSIHRGGEIELVVLSIDLSWLMDYYIVEDCKQKRTEARADLFFIGRSDPSSTPTTSPGTAPPANPCDWANQDICLFWSCIWHRYGWGGPPSPCK